MSPLMLPEDLPRPLLDFPFPLDDGRLAWMRLPGGGLNDEEVERLCAYLRALVTYERAIVVTEPSRDV